MEIERKFLISEFPALPQLERAQVRQGYLSIRPEVRIRSKRVGEKETYRLCFKSEGTLCREEVEIDLEQDPFQKLCAMLPKPMIQKDYRVYSLPEGLRLECSRVDEGSPTEFFYAEVEFQTEEQARAFIPPAFLGKEVTEDAGYRMKEYYRRQIKGEQA